jgi:hypothetical protein
MQHEPIYRQVIGEAWYLSWRNKFLWLFGFFAAFLINGGVYDLAVKMFSRTTWLSLSWQQLTTDSLSLKNILGQLALLKLGWPNLGYIIFIIFFLLLAVVFFCISIIAQGSLIHSNASSRKKKKVGREAIETGMQRFWPVLGINLTLKIAICLLVVFTSFPLFLLLAKSVLINALLQLFSYLIFIPLAVIFYFMAILASCYVVLRQENFLTSLASAWDLFRRHWLICLELGFLLFVISFLVGLGMFVLTMIFSVPIILLFLAALALESEVAFLVMLSLAILIVSAIVILGGSFLVTFQYTSWVLLFERLTTKGGVSRLARWLHHLANLHKTPSGAKKTPRPAKGKK